MASDNKRLGTVSIENARIIYRNFKGEKTKVNPAGSRNFCIVIEDPKLLKDLQADGWNVRVRVPRDEDEEPMHYLQVAVSFDNFPPAVTRVTKRGQLRLNADIIEMLDSDDIVQVDLVIRPYEWSLATGKSGVKAYLKEMYVVVAESEFAAKYEHWGEDA